MGFIVLLLFVALLLLLAMMALIFTAAVSVMGHEKPLHQEEPTCGGCGYIVKNVNEPVCAICHAEFHHVGIVMPPPPADGSAAAAWLAFRRVSGVSLGIWTIVAGIIAIRQAMDFSTGRAIATAVVSLIPVLIIEVIVGLIAFAALR